MDPVRPSLQELVRRVREVPSPEVRLSGLIASVAIAEQQLEIARHLEPEKLRQLLSAQPEHTDDQADRVYDLEVQLTHLLPKLFRGGSILAIWSTLEACTKDLAVYSARILGKPSPQALFRGSFIAACEKAFSRVSIHAFDSAATRERLALLAGVRSAIIHHNSELQALPAGIAKDRAALEEAGLYVESDLHHEYFVPTAEFVLKSLLAVDQHLRSLAARVRASAPLPPAPSDA